MKPSEQLAQLLAEAEDLERSMIALQPKSRTDSYRVESYPKDEQAIWALRDRYLEWYTKAMSLLPSDLRDQFHRHYQRAGNIKDFLTDPTERYYQQRSYNNNVTPGFRWRYPVASYFIEPFTKQRMLLQEARQRRLTQASKPVSTVSQKALPEPLSGLHPRVVVVAQQLFRDGHFRQAVFEAWLELNKAVQEKSGRPDLDGVALMELAFSPKNPLLTFEGHPDEQPGYMRILSGGVQAIRNPRAHARQDNIDEHRQESFELLAMISALFRALDRAQNAS